MVSPWLCHHQNHWQVEGALFSMDNNCSQSCHAQTSSSPAPLRGCPTLAHSYLGKLWSPSPHLSSNAAPRLHSCALQQNCHASKIPYGSGNKADTSESNSQRMAILKGECCLVYTCLLIEAAQLQDSSSFNRGLQSFVIWQSCQMASEGYWQNTLHHHVIFTFTIRSPQKYSLVVWSWGNDLTIWAEFCCKDFPCVSCEKHYWCQ